MRRVVVIDDEYIVVAGMTAILDRLNLDFHIVASASNGIDGQEVIRREKPDVVFTDIRMPGLDGLSMIENIKEELPKTVFVVISGYTEFEYARRALQLQVEDYLDKPITMEKVGKCLTDIGNRERDKKNKLMQEESEAQNGVQLDDMAINALIMSDSEALRENSRKYLQRLIETCRDFNSVKEGTYRFLCVILEIFAGQKNQYDEKMIIPCTTVMELESKGELEKYMEQVISRIIAVIEADKVSCNHRGITDALQFINDNYDKDIGLTEVAGYVNLAPAYLSILFKENVGTSYVKYLTDIRMKKAKKLLTQGYKVAEISEKVGYNNYRYFCDIFKKHTGVTPNEYRSSAGARI